VKLLDHRERHSMTALLNDMTLFIKKKIFPKVIHVKNAILEGALFLQMFFQGKGEPLGVISALKKDLTSNQPPPKKESNKCYPHHLVST